MYFCKQIIFQMAIDSLYKIKDWIDDQQKRGRITFSFQEVIEHFSLISEQGVKNALTNVRHCGQ